MRNPATSKEQQIEIGKEIIKKFTSPHEYSDFEKVMEVINGCIDSLFSTEHLFLKIICLIIFVTALVVIFSIISNRKNVVESFFRRLRVHIFGYDISLNKEEFINEQMDRFHKKSANYIDEIHVINNEEILYKFKEKPQAIKEVSYLLYLLPGAFSIILFMVTNDFLYGYITGRGVPIKATLLFLSVTGLTKIIVAMFPKQLKSCRAWAISENYFIQMKDGLVELELTRDYIFYIEFTGYEIVFDLNAMSNIAELDSGRDDRLVIEDIENPEEAYRIIKEWFEYKK